MEERQIIWPIERLMANPRLFVAIADYFEGPDSDLFSSSFYELMEHEIEENENSEFFLGECAFREKPEEPEVFQVILSNGNAIELKPSGDAYSVVRDENDLGVVSAIYGRLIKAIEAARPDLEGNIALVEVPTMANGFLRDENGDAFRGKFHLLSDPTTEFKFVVDVVDLDKDDLRARIEP